ncbi:helix-turn-helix domain-containing protein [Clavibacter californiensis]|jgi:transcriptional regulator with XRE-family HTH domain|uniref:XRE family transcriptional regulator n=1 Tax=Clavibacter californiensis TaxID=1401995 RepID=A0ABX9N3U4_9MICO|nr:helix-turn-helix transcriptional regulator [Clavibacter californiensis]PPF56306.1 Cro/Cl family transcriptional regulator [Clavibacter michiganensis]RII89881.1 XRE family transcriptional regulator [Clavibacter californiensis]UKF80688.1 helix-turn-helix domain-containing protein [Clavibacter californiensis]
MTIGQVIHGARRASGLSQRELSSISGVAQSTVSEVESGHRVPSVTTVERLLRSTGHQLVAIPTRRSDAAAAAEGIARSLSSRRGDHAVRHFIQLADDLAAEHGSVRFVLAIAEPAPTGAQHWDAAIAALVEHRLEEEGLPVPAWVASDERRLADEWTFGSGRYAIPVDRDRVPEAFLRHGVLLDADTLVSV